MSRFEIYGKSSLEQIEKERSEQLYDKPVRIGENLERALSRINFDGMDPDDIRLDESAPLTEEQEQRMRLEVEKLLYDDFKNERTNEVEKRSALRNALLNDLSQKSNSSEYEQDISLGGPKR